MNQIFGIKQNITQTWEADGVRLPVSILLSEPMLVTQVKHAATDGYEAIQVGFGRRPAKNVNQPETNHLKKAKSQTLPRFVKEIRLTEPGTYQLGDLIQPTDLVHEGDFVSVTGTTKGRGFSGVMKRHGFKGGPKTHGQSDRARAPGSIGQGTSPGRIHKGKKMAGHYGHTTHWLKRVSIVKIDHQNHTIWLKGPIPGARGSVITVKVIHPKGGK